MTGGYEVAVTGGTGFIGSHVCSALATAGFSVRMLAGPPSETRRPGQDFDGPCIYADITEPAPLLELFRGVRVVVNAAGPPSVSASFRDPAEYMRVHAWGTAVVADACVRAGVKRLVHVSSAEVYGNRTPEIVSESQPMLAASPYGAAKIGAEQVVRALAAAGKFEAIALRPFSIYGPGMPSQGVVSEFLHSAARRETIVVRDPVPVRDFCFIADIAQAVTLACSAKLDGFETVNLATGVPTSIGSLAALAAALANAPGIQEGGDKRPAASEVNRLIGSTERAMHVLNWRASTPLREGLAKTLAWVRGQLG